MARSALAVVAVVAVVALAGGVSASAHHSYAGFFDPRQRTVAVEGQLESILYANPHVVMKIRTADSTISDHWIWRSTTEFAKPS